MSDSTITASYTVPSQTQFVLSNSNNVSFGTNASTVTATASFSQSIQTQGSVLVNGSSGSIVFSNSNGFTFGNNNSTITASYTVPTVTNSSWSVSAGTSSKTVGDLVFSNSNGVSFGLNGNTITATVKTDYLTTQSVQTQNMVSVLGSTGDISFADSNGISFGGNASTITASHNGLTSQSNQAFSAQGGSSAFQTLIFTNSNGFSFSNTGGSIWGSYTVPTQTAQPGIQSISGGTTRATTGEVVFSNSNGVSFGVDGQTITATVATTYAASNHSHGNPTLALTNLTGTTASASNGFTLSLSAAGAGSINVSAGTTSNNLTNLEFADLNGITFGLDGSTITGSVETAYQSQGAYLTTAAQSTQTNAFSLGGNTGTTNSSILSAGGYVIAGGSNITLSMSNNSLSIHAQSQSNAGFSAGAASSTFQTLSFQDSNGVSFSNNAGAIRITHGLQFTSATSAITSAALHTSEAFRAIYDGANSVSTGTLRLTNANGVTFTLNGQTLSGSVATTYRASNDALGLNTAQTNVTWTANSAGVSLNAAGYAGTGTTFNGANISGSITQNSVGLNLSLSVAAPGAAAESNWHHLLGANTAGDTTVSGSTLGFSGVNLTLSGTNASRLVISAPATSSLSATGQLSISTNGSTISIGVPSEITYSGWNPYEDLAGTFTTNQASLMFDAVDIPVNIQFDRYYMIMNNTNATNSSGSHTLSFWLGIYTKNDSTLSLLTSSSSSTAVTHSGTAGSYSRYSGMRIFTVPMTTTLTQGKYWLGCLSRTSSGGANGSYSLLVASALGSFFLGHFGTAHNSTMQKMLGQGVYTATTTGIPGSVEFSQIRGSDPAVERAAYLIFASGTV